MKHSLKTILAQFATLCAVSSFIVVLVFAFVYQWASVPIVYESFSKRVCVFVDDPSLQYDCNNKPKTFIHVWKP